MGTRVRSSQQTFVGHNSKEQGQEWIESASLLGWKFTEWVFEGEGDNQICTVYLQFVGEQQDQSALAVNGPPRIPLPPHDEGGQPINRQGYTPWEQWVIDEMQALQSRIGELERGQVVHHKAIKGELVFEPGLSPAPRPWNRT